MSNFTLEKQMHRYGLSIDDVCKCDGYDGPTRIGASGAGSNIKPVKTLQTSNLDEMKKWAGNDDALYASGQIKQGPEAPDHDAKEFSADSIDKLTPDQREKLIKGAEAYVWGDSSKAKAWKPTIEKFFAPFSVAVSAVQDITVTPANPWIIDNPPGSVINVGTVTVEEGGEIIIKSSVKINIEKLVQK
ncbi:hypothetical protein [Alteromonas sp. S015]|uniref:hypothetical protein n=1 Tax=Alteromonas sp. S015 TaxID=3117401 RepID=UPI002FDFF793